MPSAELRSAALAALQLTEPSQKCAAVQALRAAQLLAAAERQLDEPAGLPGRPNQPILVPPAQLATRSAGSRAGRAALLHALAHIEFNAINLALDAIWRFAGQPQDYYQDWLQVAAEEAEHYGLLVDRLQAHDTRYGDFPAHDGLWEMAAKTRGDLLARLALVPRTLEARGLDASPLVRAKFAAAGDAESAEVVDTILRDEIGHVAIGNRWFNQVCAERGLEPVDTAARLAGQYAAPRLRGPFNLAARRAAGFDERELAQMEAVQPRE
jgi:uncharacterized ferritin-like protein (DUF455 family)